MTLTTFFVMWGSFLVGFVGGCTWRGYMVDEIAIDNLNAALSISRRIIRDQKMLIDQSTQGATTHPPGPAS